MFELPSVMELPSVVGSYIQLAAVGNGKCQPAAVGSSIWKGGCSYEGYTARRRVRSAEEESEVSQGGAERQTDSGDAEDKTPWPR